MRIHFPHCEGRLGAGVTCALTTRTRPSLCLRRALASRPRRAPLPYARTHAGTVTEAYDARALAGARRSYVPPTTARPSPFPRCGRTLPTRSPTPSPAPSYMRVHRPQNAGLVGLNCAPRVLRLCRAPRPLARAGRAAANLSRRLGQRPRPRRDRHCGRRRPATDARARQTVMCRHEARRTVDERSDSGADAAADDPTRRRRRQPNGAPVGRRSWSAVEFAGISVRTLRTIRVFEARLLTSPASTSRP